MTKNEGTILIADDRSPIREYVKGYLEAVFFDYKVEEYENGKALEERLKQEISNPGKVKLLITDNEMPPGRTGSELIRDYSVDLRFPVIMHYGGERSIGQEAVKNGAFDYLIKGLPNNFNQFVEVVGRALNSSSKH